MKPDRGALPSRGAPFFFICAALLLNLLVMPAAWAQNLRDLAYGPDKAQRLDVYLPSADAPSSGAPILLMVHGGAWKIGDKHHHAVVSGKTAHWNARGFVVVSANYRLNVPPDQQAADIKAAIDEIRRQAPSWHADATRLAVMGHSAGAHLIALLYARLGDQLDWRGAILLDSAALDVPAIMSKNPARFYRQAFGSDPRRWQALSPLHQLRQPPVPLLAVCSTHRRASCEQAKSFVARIQALGGQAQLLPQPLSHRQINDSLGTDPAYTMAVDRFIDAVTAP